MYPDGVPLEQTAAGILHVNYWFVIGWSAAGQRTDRF